MEVILRSPLPSAGRTLVPSEHAVRSQPRSGDPATVRPDTPDDDQPRLQAPAAPEPADAPEARLARERGFEQGQREGLEQGWASGQAQGYEAGRQQAADELRQEMASRLQRLAQLVDELVGLRRQALEVAEDDIACAVFEAICQLVGRHLVSRAGVAAHVHAVLARVAEPSGVRIRLHPQDLALLQAARGESPAGPPAEWIADDAMSHGGCVIESSTGLFRARLDEQLQHVLAVLADARRRVDTVAPLAEPDAQPAPAQNAQPPAAEAAPAAAKPFSLKWGTA